MTETFNGADGRKVVAADTAETIGDVKGFVVDTAATRIESIHVAGRGRRAEVIAWSSIASFGADAVMVEAAAATDKVSSEHETQAVKGKIDARDARVLGSDGFEYGTVADVMFDPDTGRLTGALTSDGRIGSSRLRALGSYALIIDPA